MQENEMRQPEELYYKSTRNDTDRLTASEAILQGLAKDGGLFVPSRIPQLETPLRVLADYDYQQLAYEVMRLYLTDYTEEELRACIAKAYDEKFDTPEIAPLREADGAWYLELYHGATIAFKDMALSILPHLMTTAAKKNQVTDEIVILTATSGDTGKAALAGFADVAGTKIVVFYPKGGVSAVQERQMVTQRGANTFVVGVQGNFDDTQTGVKEIFSDRAFEAEMRAQGIRFSSANSINIGRLVPQIVYYVYAYTRLLKAGVLAEGEAVNFTVPTGNFGNILAAYYASRMGVPVHRLICASNENKVLYDFFQSGRYDKNRAFLLTSSPSMDILISSNLERLIYEIAGENAEVTAELMRALRETGTYEIMPEMRGRLSLFVGGYAREEAVFEALRAVYTRAGYVLDTHTAVAASVYDNYRKETADATKTVIVSTASPYKFAASVVRAITGEALENGGLFAAVDALTEQFSLRQPPAVEELRTAPVLHDRVCARTEMKAVVRALLNNGEQRK